MSLSRLGRFLFGGVSAFDAINHLRNAEAMSGYAESEGVPAADLAVPFSGGLLLVGGLAIALWRLPRIAAGAIATFLAVATPTMHDFWDVEGESQAERDVSAPGEHRVARRGAVVAPGREQRRVEKRTTGRRLTAFPFR